MNSRDDLRCPHEIRLKHKPQQAVPYAITKLYSTEHGMALSLDGPDAQRKCPLALRLPAVQSTLLTPLIM